MPLNEKGKKILASMKKQYGTKKGESVFYAMENSGKLTKVVKARGGMDASKSDFGVSTPSPGDTGGAGGFDRDTQQFGDRGSSPTSTGGKGTPTALSFSQTSSPNNTQSKVSFMPASVQLIGAVANAATKGYRNVKAKGENILSRKVTLPSTRDYYRTTGKPLDVMSPEGKQYLIDDKRIMKPNPIKVREDDATSINVCPDGSPPPCKLPTTQLNNNTMKPKTGFLSGFQAYEDGGEVIISGNVDKDLL